MELDRLFQKKLKVFENGVFHGQLAGALQTVFRRMLSHTGKECGQKCYSHQRLFCAAVSVWHHPDLSEEVGRPTGNGEALPDPATAVL